MNINTTCRSTDWTDFIIKAPLPVLPSQKSHLCNEADTFTLASLILGLLVIMEATFYLNSPLFWVGSHLKTPFLFSAAVTLIRHILDGGAVYRDWSERLLNIPLLSSSSSASSFIHSKQSTPFSLGKMKKSLSGKFEGFFWCLGINKQLIPSGLKTKYQAHFHDSEMDYWEQKWE